MANHLSNSVSQHQDFRRILDDPAIDAVVIATPNHWHAVMTIMACQAGKHVYVQKPVSHGIWEGRKMVEAARRYNRIVQAGTQHRSCPAVSEARADILAGKYGQPQWAHCSVLHTREPIGLVTEPQPIPDHIDYNLWTGPAPLAPVMRKEFHYDWHWQWNWGDGETGNWGPHYVDDLRNLLENEIGRECQNVYLGRKTILNFPVKSLCPWYPDRCRDLLPSRQCGCVGPGFAGRLRLDRPRRGRCGRLGEHSVSHARHGVKLQKVTIQDLAGTDRS